MARSIGLTLLVLSVVILIGCAGQLNAIPDKAATETAIAGQAFATLTAQAPTATHTPAPTNTPTLAPTATATSTATSTPTLSPTGTAALPPGGYTVSGHVAEFPPCFGSMRGVNVILKPTGRSMTSDFRAARFSFEHVPDGDYTIVISPRCNPFGCWPEIPVIVAGADVELRVCPVARGTPTPVSTPQLISSIILI